MLSRRLRSTLAAPAALMMVAAAVLAGCSTGSDDRTDARPTVTAAPGPSATATPEAPDLGRFVALGDSYSAGPGVGAADPDSGFCPRSAGAWPTLLASLTSADVTDVSCSGATTTNALDPVTGPFGDLPAQLDAVTADSELVTVQLGGNDGGLFSSLVGSCVQQQGTACRTYVDDTAPTVLDTTVDSLTSVLDRARAAAPDATVVLVGYLRLAPESGTCAALGVSDATVDLVRAAEQQLDDALAEAAERADVPFVSMRDVSTGHDACAGAEAWTNGGQVAGGDGIVFHPRSAGMQAVAQQVLRAIG